MQQDDHDPGLPDMDLSDLTAQLLRAIASEPVPAGIARLARDLQAAIDRQDGKGDSNPAGLQGQSGATAD